MLTDKNRELEGLINLSSIVKTLEASVKTNIREIEHYTNALEHRTTSGILECMSNLNKNFSEYLDILEDFKKYKQTVNKRNNLMYSILGEGSINETRGKFIKVVNKMSSKRYTTSQGLISNILSNKYSNDNSLCLSHKSKESITENDIKEICSNNIKLGNKSRKPHPSNMLEFPLKQVPSVKILSINESLFKNYATTLYKYNSMINPSNVNTLNPKVMIIFKIEGRDVLFSS